MTRRRANSYNGALNPDIVERRVTDRSTGKLHVVKTQKIDPKFFDAVRSAKDITASNRVLKYRGSIPLLLAQRWAVECGSAIGTREFNAYAWKKMQDSDYKRLAGG